MLAKYYIELVEKLGAIVWRILFPEESRPSPSPRDLWYVITGWDGSTAPRVSDEGHEYTIYLRYIGAFVGYEIRRGGVPVMRVSGKLADAFEQHLRLYLPTWRLFSEGTRAQAIDEACAEWIQQRTRE